MTRKTSPILILVFTILILLLLGCGFYIMKEQYEQSRPNLQASTSTFDSNNFSSNDISLESNDSFKSYDSYTATSLLEQSFIGWNLGHTFEYNDMNSPRNINGSQSNYFYETSFGNPVVTNELLHFVAFSGFTCVRIPVSFYLNSYEDEEGCFYLQTAWLSRLREVIDACMLNDLKVILCEYDNPEWYFSEENLRMASARTVQLWTQLSNYFASYDQRLMFEAFGNTSLTAQGNQNNQISIEELNHLNQIFVNTVRSTGNHNTNRILIVGPYLHAFDTKILDQFAIPTDSASQALVVDVYCNEAAIDQSLEPTLVTLESYSKKWNIPVIIGKYGIKQGILDSKNRGMYVSNFITRANSHGMACFLWDDGNINTYGIINRQSFFQSEEQVLEGLNNPCGIINQVQQETSFHTKEEFSYGAIDSLTGRIIASENGSLVLHFRHNNYVLAEGKSYTISLYSSDQAKNLKLKKIAFYDSNKSFISLQVFNPCNTISFSAPRSSEYIQIELSDPYEQHDWMQYSRMFEENNLSIKIKEFTN